MMSEINQSIIKRTLRDFNLQGKAESTIACYKSDLNKCGIALTKLDLSFAELTKRNLTELLELVQTTDDGNRLSPRLSGVFSALSSLMEFLVFNDEVESNCAIISQAILDSIQKTARC